MDIRAGAQLLRTLAYECSHFHFSTKQLHDTHLEYPCLEQVPVLYGGNRYADLGAENVTCGFLIEESQQFLNREYMHKRLNSKVPNGVD